MAITLPAEIVTIKNKVSAQPIILVEFVDKDYHVSTRDYSLTVQTGADGSVTGTTFTSATATFQTNNAKDGDKIFVQAAEHVISSVTNETTVILTTAPGDGVTLAWEHRQVYADLIKKDSSNAISQTISQNLDRLSSFANITLNLLSFRSVLRSKLLATPDLNNTTVRIYLKFASASVSSSDAVKVYEGTIKKWKQSKDVLTLNIIARKADFGNIPTQTIKETDPTATIDTDICHPLQYGDFFWDVKPGFYVDQGSGVYAVTPYKGIITGTTPGAIYFNFRCSSHEMNEFPTPTQIREAATGNGYAFIRRNDNLLMVDNLTVQTTNAVGGSDILLEQTHSIYKWLWPMQAYTGPGPGTQPADVANTLDGDSTTTCLVNGSNESLYVHSWDENWLSGDHNQIRIYLYITAITSAVPATANVHLRKKSDDSSVATYVIDTGVTPIDQWVEVIAYGINEKQDTANDYYLEVTPITTTRTVTIAGIALRADQAKWNPETDEKCLYVRCKGREFSGTWDGRKTAGNLIENPLDMLESIFRDELNYTAILTSVFDALNAAYASINVNASIVRQIVGRAFLDQFARGFGIGISISATNDIVLVPRETTINFTASNSGTATDEDIFSDVDVLANETYSRHPMLLGSFEVESIEGDILVKQLVLNHNRDFSGIYRDSVKEGAGSSTTNNNPFISKSATATLLAQKLHEFSSTNRLVCRFSSFLNAIRYQVGDVINVRHSALVDSMLKSQSVDSQRWAITGIQAPLVKGLINITAMELPGEKTIYVPPAGNLMVFFDFLEMSKTTQPFGGHFPDATYAPANWIDPANNNNASLSVEWAYSTIDANFNMTTNGLQVTGISPAAGRSPWRMRYNNTVTQGLLDTVYPAAGKALIIEIGAYRPDPVNGGSFFSGPNTTSTDNLYLQMESTGRLVAHVTENSNAFTIADPAATNYKNQTGQYVMLIKPQVGATPGEIVIYYNGTRIASTPFTETSIVAPSSDPRVQIGKRIQTASNRNVLLTARYLLMYNINITDLPANYDLDIIMKNYQFFKDTHLLD